MSKSLQALLSELEQFGQENDAAITDRPRRMLNITRDTGEFLRVLVQATRARRVLEIGTSNGYSTLWLAQGQRPLAGTSPRWSFPITSLSWPPEILSAQASLNLSPSAKERRALTWIACRRPALTLFFLIRNALTTCSGGRVSSAF